MKKPRRDKRRPDRLRSTGEWIAFSVRNHEGGKIFVDRFDGSGRGRATWIAISSGSEKDFVPAWSRDGNLLYLLSQRDGSWCIWGQRLSPRTKQPIGQTFAVRHFHEFPGHLSAPPPEAAGLSIAGDRLVFSLFDMTGNVWLAKWK
jgi:hypothetical protein